MIPSEQQYNIICRISGEDLDYFFNRWLTRKGIPALRLESPSVDHQKSGYLLSFWIKQSGELYIVDLPIKVITEKEVLTLSIRIRGRLYLYRGFFSERPLRIVIDENYDVMRKLTAPEVSPVISAFTGDKRNPVLYPEGYREAYRDILKYFEEEGYRVMNENEIGDALKRRSPLIITKHFQLARRLFNKYWKDLTEALWYRYYQIL